MIFVNDPILDVRRLQYKKAYDEVFNQIHDAMDDPKLLNTLRKKEKKLQLKTAKFIKENAYYFARNRAHHFNNMERHGMFGDQREK